MIKLIYWGFRDSVLVIKNNKYGRTLSKQAICSVYDLMKVIFFGHILRMERDWDDWNKYRKYMNKNVVFVTMW